MDEAEIPRAKLFFHWRRPPLFPDFLMMMERYESLLLVASCPPASPKKEQCSDDFWWLGDQRFLTQWSKVEVLAWLVKILTFRVGYFTAYSYLLRFFSLIIYEKLWLLFNSSVGTARPLPLCSRGWRFLGIRTVQSETFQSRLKRGPRFSPSRLSPKTVQSETFQSDDSSVPDVSVPG